MALTSSKRMTPASSVRSRPRIARISSTATKPTGDAQQMRQQASTETRYRVNQSRRAAAGTAQQSDADDAAADGAAAVCTTSFRNKVLDAVKFAHGMWRQLAHFQNLRVNAVIALGSPGCLDGPSLAAHIRTAPTVAGCQGLEEEIVDAVADAIGASFAAWQDQVTVPGLPWYPAFAAFPGPMAPPMPNVPTPLMACPSSQSSKLLSSTDLARELKDSLPPAARVPAVNAFMDNIGSCLATGFSVWLGSQMVIGVMGKGPVPTFAPPYVPVGPVVGGDNIATPGHLASGTGLNPPRLPYVPA